MLCTQLWLLHHAVNNCSEMLQEHNYYHAHLWNGQQFCFLNNVARYNYCSLYVCISNNQIRYDTISKRESSLIEKCIN